jgi:hypothetical protein
MTHRSVWLPLWIVALCVSAGVGVAQDKPALSESLRGEAKVHYDRGRELHRAEDYRAALSEFEAAYSEINDPRLLWNMAACERRLQHFARVLKLLQQYLTLGGSTLTNAEKLEAAQGIAAARDRVGMVTIDSEPTGAEVVVDGERMGLTPLGQAVPIDPGTHKVLFRSKGFSAVERVETIHAGEQVRWQATLQPAARAEGETRERPMARPAVRAASGGQRDRGGMPAGTGSSSARWVMGGAGAVVAIAGGTMLVLAHQRYNNLESQCSPTCDPSDWQSMRSVEMGGGSALGLGLSTLAAAVTWWILDPPRP